MAKQLPTLNISGEVLNDVFVPFISRKQETCQPLIVHEGGRASGKSDAISQFLITIAYSTKKRILLMRKVEKSIRNSSYRLIRDYVNKWKLRDFFNFVSSMLTIKVLNGSEFICMGFDEAEKIKSIANIDIVWIAGCKLYNKLRRWFLITA